MHYEEKNNTERKTERTGKVVVRGDELARREKGKIKKERWKRRLFHIVWKRKHCHIWIGPTLVLSAVCEANAVL
jgi:hypothetical protein